MDIQLIRSATLRLNYSGKIFLIDPYLSPKFSRPSYAGKSKNPLVDLPFTIDTILKDIDYLIVSHTHSDHFDVMAKEVIPKNIPVICQEQNHEEIRKLGFENVQYLKDTINLGNITLHHMPGQHGSGTVLDDMGPVMGFMFTAQDEPVLYWAGDTILTEEIKKIVRENKPDVIVTHSCGATWGSGVLILMDDLQTIELAKIAENSTIIAVHMEAVDHATITRSDLRNSANKANIGNEKLVIPKDGERIKINL